MKKKVAICLMTVGVLGIALGCVSLVKGDTRK